MIGWLLQLAGLRAKPSRSADPRLVSFARGLALGALAGAAIAGSSIWSRRRQRDG